MAKLQQMNEMTKQNSQILLCNGYVTYEGKRYSDCVPFEQEAFNKALHVVRGGEKHPIIINLFEVKKENYTPSGKVSKAMFDCLISKAHSVEDSNIDEFSIEAKHGVYELFIRGAWVYDEQTKRSIIQIVYNESWVIYKGEYYDLHFTDDQTDVLIDLLAKEYDRLDKEAEYKRVADIEDEIAYHDELNTLNYSQFGFLTI